jgi:hypothetical protein
MVARAGGGVPRREGADRGTNPLWGRSHSAGLESPSDTIVWSTSDTQGTEPPDVLPHS